MVINEITFSKTGNFWIDNGIVGLYRVYVPVGTFQEILNEDKQPINYEALLYADKLKIRLLDAKEIEEHTEKQKGTKKKKNETIHPDLLAVLNWAKEEIVNQYYLTKTDGAGWFYMNGQFEVYQKTDFKTGIEIH